MAASLKKLAQSAKLEIGVPWAGKQKWPRRIFATLRGGERAGLFLGLDDEVVGGVWAVVGIEYPTGAPTRVPHFLNDARLRPSLGKFIVPS